jgi:hypothetical protein
MRLDDDYPAAYPLFLTISTTVKLKTRNMKLTLIATAFAALLSTGHAAEEINQRNLDAVPVAGVEAPAMETQGMEPVVVKDGKRTLVAEDDATAAAAKAPKMTNEEGKKAGGKKRALGNKKDYSGQSCSLCCDDDYHC